MIHPELCAHIAETPVWGATATVADAGTFTAADRPVRTGYAIVIAASRTPTFETRTALRDALKVRQAHRHCRIPGARARKSSRARRGTPEYGRGLARQARERAGLQVPVFPHRLRCVDRPPDPQCHRRPPISMTLSAFGYPPAQRRPLSRTFVADLPAISG